MKSENIIFCSHTSPTRLPLVTLMYLKYIAARPYSSHCRKQHQIRACSTIVIYGSTTAIPYAFPNKRFKSELNPSFQTIILIVLIEREIGPRTSAIKPYRKFMKARESLSPKHYIIKSAFQKCSI